MNDDNSLKLFLIYYSLPHISCLLTMLSIKSITITGPVFRDGMPVGQEVFMGLARSGFKAAFHR